LACNRRFLGDTYLDTVAQLQRAYIPYHSADGGLTMLLDFSQIAPHFGEGWEGERVLHDLLLKQARVHVARGKDFGLEVPGWMRLTFASLTFAEPKEAVEEAILRIQQLFIEKNVQRIAIRESVLFRLERIWRRSDQIFGFLKPEAFQVRPIQLRHPFLFYLGHLPAFLWNQLRLFVPSTPQFNEEFAKLFDRGIDPDVDTGTVHANSAGADRTQWPDVSRIVEFRDQVRKKIAELVDAVLALDNTKDEELRNCRIFELVIEHEAMHQETLLYMLNCLDTTYLQEPAIKEFMASLAQRAPMTRKVDKDFVHIPGNNHLVLGVPLNDASHFGWDNEFPEHTVSVQPFAIRKTPVTNREFLSFEATGGYTKRDLWEDDDWNWVTEKNIKHPVHWVAAADGGWKLRVLFGTIDLAGDVLDWPAQVSLAEAKAWCRWKGDGSRLPTEAEWFHATYSEPTEGKEGFSVRKFPWGSAPPATYRGNFDFSHFAPTPVQQYEDGINYWGMWDLVGNGWEWTLTEFAGFPGYRPYLHTYPGYSADFFDGKHFVLRGGSFATVSIELRNSFRNWYQGRYPYVFSKFRPVRPLQNLLPSPVLLPNSSSGAIVKGDIFTRLEYVSKEHVLREFSQSVLAGLSNAVQPTLSSQWLYDDSGSQIYQEITTLEEYYPTRTEHAILKTYKAEIANLILADRPKLWQKFNLAELGCGDGHKTQVLMDHFVSTLNLNCTFYPIDISEGALQSLLDSGFRAPRISPIVGQNLVGLSYVVSQTTCPSLVLFLGSSIGNFDNPEAQEFIQKVHDVLRVGDYFLIGFDLIKVREKKSSKEMFFNIAFFSLSRILMFCIVLIMTQRALPVGSTTIC
jgi:ergothioneine biosynthesis protein EgtB